jgi:hypothetical protein
MHSQAQGSVARPAVRRAVKWMVQPMQPALQSVAMPRVQEQAYLSQNVLQPHPYAQPVQDAQVGEPYRPLRFFRAPLPPHLGRPVV